MPIIRSTSQIDGKEVDLYIEVDTIPPSDEDELFRDGSAKKAVKAVGDLFGDGLELSRNCAAQVIDSVNKMSNATRPDEFEVQLAIKLDSQVGAVIAKASAGAQMQVTMKWKLKETPKQP